MSPAQRLVALALVAVFLTACGADTAAADPADPAASAASGERPAVQRTLTARGIELQPADLRAPAGIDILIAFDNTDPGVPHGLALYADPAQTVSLGSAEVVVGPTRQSIHVAALAPGRYQFSCFVHPHMIADLVVGS